MWKDSAKGSTKISSPVSRSGFCVAARSESGIELGEWVKVPTTYAGGAKGQLLLALWGGAVRLTDPLSADISDLDLVDRLSAGRVDLTYGR